MIGRLRGMLIAKSPPWVVVDVAGVGYEIETPMSTVYDLPNVGCEVHLLTHYVHKDDSVALYGFLRENERRLFRDLQRVTGIGAKIALAVLSSVSVATFGQLIQANDVTALTRIPGIGKKTAQRMLLELRDHVSQVSDQPLAWTSAITTDSSLEAVAALQQLGYKPAEATRMVREAKADGDTVTTLIRKALQAALR